MNCDQAIEILPWLLNDTLDAGEREEVRRHLETCDRCREALAETREAGRIFSQHLPTETLVALAYGEALTGLDPALVERHLASCPQCAAELEMVNTSRRLEEDDKIAVFRGKSRRQTHETENYRGWRSAALAASLAGLVAVGGWVHSARQAQQFEAGLASQEQGAASPTKIASSAAPQPQAAMFLNVSPDEAVERGKARQITDLPAGAPQPVLALGSPRPTAFRDYDVEIRDAGSNSGSGGPLFTVHGVQRNQDGYYTLSVPRGSLKPGAYTIQVFGVEGSRREALETYSVRQP